MPLTPLGDALHKKSKALSGKQDASSPVIEIAEKVFEDIFGKDRAVHVKPLFLKNRTLTVTCSSTGMAQDIRVNQTEIVRRINEKLGEKEVDRIRYLA